MQSTSGYVFSVGSAAISSSSKRQSAVSTSTTESEYKGQFSAALEARISVILASISCPRVPSDRFRGRRSQTGLLNDVSCFVGASNFLDAGCLINKGKS